VSSATAVRRFARAWSISRLRVPQGSLSNMCGNGQRVAMLHRLKIFLPATGLLLLCVCGCTPEKARTHLHYALVVDRIEIVHARFPCWSPDLHLFGYRFRAIVKNGQTLGEICWDFSTGSWSSWQWAPNQLPPLPPQRQVP